MTSGASACCWPYLFCMILSLLAWAAMSCAPSDLAALRSFAASFPRANFSDWAVSDDCCAWGPSVVCTPASPHHHDPSSRDVTGLLLDADTGLLLDADTDTVEREMSNYPIPTSVCRLSSLTTLSLVGLSLIGPIPPCIGINLSNLVLLDLSGNSLTGQLPKLFFSTLHSLQYLDLSHNYLSGPIFSLNLLPNLTFLDLSGNDFSGPIPSFIDAPKLSSLVLERNSFSGTIASFLAPSFPFASLKHLVVSSNLLSGEIPTFDPSRFPSLVSLWLDDNQFEGSLPKSLCGLADLQELGVSENKLSQLLAPSHSYCRLNNLISLDASYNQLNGSFPEWIGSLRNLQYLYLSYNNFNGSLPKSWQNLVNLTLLDLSGISGLVAENHSTPKLPSWVFTLPSIGGLYLSSMKLQVVDIDCSSLLQMVNIGPRDDPLVNLDFSYNRVSLDFSDNNFTSDMLQCIRSYTLNDSGSIHETWGNMMIKLNFSGNPLGLDLDDPESVKRLPRFSASLDLSGCGLRGHLTSLFFYWIGSSVERLHLADNHLVGQVPPHLGNLSFLSDLDLSHNQFTGFSPLVDKLTFIDTLQLSNNNLVGDLSSLILNIFNLSRLGFTMYNFDVSYNSLTGSIPPFLANFITWGRRLMLSGNHLEGSLPHELFENAGAVEYFKAMSLSNNNLCGHMPSSLRNLKGLVFLDLSHNRFEGSLDESMALFNDASFGQFSRLRVLLLGYNNFTGSVPSSLASIAPSLQVIDFSNNHLTGSIPVHTLQNLPALRIVSHVNSNANLTFRRGVLFEEITLNTKGTTLKYLYVLEALTSVDFSGNNLSGPIPMGLGKLSGLVLLNLSRNGFSGPIPSDLGMLSRQLQSLDISYNKLVGPIPSSFQNLTGLEVFNVSYNEDLSGPIPRNQPQFEFADSYIGDPNLCGDPILQSCASAVQNPPPLNTNLADNKPNGFAKWIDDWIAIPGFFLGMVVGLLGTFYALWYLKVCK